MCTWEGDWALCEGWAEITAGRSWHPLLWVGQFSMFPKARGGQFHPAESQAQTLLSRMEAPQVTSLPLLQRSLLHFWGCQGHIFWRSRPLQKWLMRTLLLFVPSMYLRVGPESQIFSISLHLVQARWGSLPGKSPFNLALGVLLPYQPDRAFWLIFCSPEFYLLIYESIASHSGLGWRCTFSISPYPLFSFIPFSCSNFRPIYQIHIK